MENKSSPCLWYVDLQIDALQKPKFVIYLRILTLHIITQNLYPTSLKKSGYNKLLIGNIFLTKPAIRDCNGIRTHNYVVRKRTLNHSAKMVQPKWFSTCLRTKWLKVRIPLHLLNLQIPRLLRERSFLILRQLQSVDSL